jgi:DNA-binding NtrC family response regulator
MDTGQNRDQASTAVPPDRSWGMVGNSAALREMRGRLERLARQPRPVLIWGENGSGKSMAAQALHLAAGGAENRLTKISCGSLDWSQTDWPDGRPRAGRCLLLEEVPGLPRPAQSWLAAWLEETAPLPDACEWPARPAVIATAGQDPGTLKAAGRLQGELLRCFQDTQVRVPPLRERGEDIPELARHFLRQSSARRGEIAGRLGDETLGLLKAYAWPGNLRELMNAMEYASLLSRGGPVTPGCLPPFCAVEPACGK